MLKYVFSLLLIGCDPDYNEVNVNHCHITCYEKGNNEPVYRVNCEGHAQAAIKDATQMKARITIKSKFLDVWSPYQKICDKQKDEYSSCFISFSSKGNYR